MCREDINHKLSGKKGAYIIRENVTFCNDFPPLPTNYNESRRNEKFILELEKRDAILLREEMVFQLQIE